MRWLFIISITLIMLGVGMAVNKKLNDNEEKANVSQVNDNFNEVERRLNTNVVKDATGTPRVLIGRQKGQGGRNEFTGIKVSQSGNDVTTASSNNLIMSSAFNMLKIVDSGTATVTVPSSGFTAYNYYSTTYSHNLGYKPSFLVFVDGSVAGLDQTNGNSIIVDSSGNIALSTYIETDNNNIKFYVAAANVGYAGDYVFKYYLIRETAN